MATNTGSGLRRGAVTRRTQFQSRNRNWVERHERSSCMLDQKSSPGRYKIRAKEPDGRDTRNS